MKRSKVKSRTIHTIWRAVDSAFPCVVCEGGESPDSSVTLAQYLQDLGFDIPECISYCLADNEYYSLKYRVFGPQVEIFINYYTD